MDVKGEKILDVCQKKLLFFFFFLFSLFSFLFSKILKKKCSYVVILPSFFKICSYATAYAIGSSLREYRKLNKVSVFHFLLLSLVAGISGTSQVFFFGYYSQTLPQMLGREPEEKEKSLHHSPP
ncbi:hypothetical protein E2542_SST14961 [Spatholobus suberectus]|nr:hypothetical protein E2542_SST14961 [Spatholobus suberectus]